MPVARGPDSGHHPTLRDDDTERGEPRGPPPSPLRSSPSPAVPRRHYNHIIAFCKYPSGVNRREAARGAGNEAPPAAAPPPCPAVITGGIRYSIRCIRHLTPVSGDSTSDSGGAFDIRRRPIRHLTPVHSTSGSDRFDIRLRFIRHLT